MFKLLKHFNRREWLMVLASVFFIVVQVWLDLTLPGYMATITTLVETEGSDINEILLYGFYMLLCALGSMVASIITGYFAANIAAGLAKTLRRSVFTKVMKFGDEEISLFSTPSLITRTTNDITQIQMFIAMGLQAIVKAPILIVWAIIKISGQQWQWSVATAAAVVFILIMIVIAVTLVLPRFKIIQYLTDNLNRVTRENLSGIRVVRAYNAENYQNEKFEVANDNLTNTNLFANRVLALISPSMSFVSSGITLAIYWIGAFLINAAGMEARLTIFSEMVVFSAYAMQIIMAFTMLSMMFIMLPRVMVSVRRINQVIDTKIIMKNGTLKNKDTKVSGTVEFRNVSFRYPGASEDILHNISFQINKGETLAIIGATASGKTTLIDLIPRFYDVTSGQVLVDGIDVRDYDLFTLREKIGYISQKAFLFSGDIAFNVSYGKSESNNEKISEAIDIAQASEFVNQMPDSINSNISQSGTNISGGQKQRLSIARAIYKNPEIFIFDDSFSALDYKTDKMLRKALDRHTNTTTKIIVAQRIGTIKNADKIVVLDDGKLVGMGTHKKLLDTCFVYREIAKSQLSKEELNYV